MIKKMVLVGLLIPSALPASNAHALYFDRVGVCEWAIDCIYNMGDQDDETGISWSQSTCYNWAAAFDCEF